MKVKDMAQAPRQKSRDFDKQSLDTKGPTEPSSDNSKPVKIKSEFPRKKFALSILIMILGIALAYFANSIMAPNPTPFNGKFDLFSLKSWLQPIEKNGIYRVTILNTSSPIKEYAVIGELLALKFASGQGKSISPTGVLSDLSANNSEQLSTQQNIDLANDTNELSENSKTQIDQLFVSIPKDSRITKVTLSGYVGLPSIPQQKQPSKNVQYQQQIQQKSYSPAPTELAEETHEDANSISSRFVRIVRDHIVNRASAYNVVENAYGLSRHYSNGWQAGAGQSSGVVIEIEYQVNGVTWLAFSPANINILSSWQIVNGNIFNYTDNNNNLKTIAALASAFISADPNALTLNQQGDMLLPTTSLPSPELYPSAFSLLILFTFGFLSIRTLRVTHTEHDLNVVSEQQIIDNFISDAPANDRAQDKLGFVEISKALSSFLRNTGTKAPLTLAISGVWGSGKSSLMNFLKQNLESYRIRPVWINAWHHQNEEQFLAGLLNAVQSKAIPHFWTAAGLLYRWNLFKMRWSESPFMYLVASLFFFGSISYWLTLQEFDISMLSSPKDKENWQNFTAIITTLLGGVPLLLASMNNLSRMVTSNNPIRLLFGSPGRNLDLRSNVGLREKFAKEFNLLCKALGDSTLTIFIDDLDRCKESRIMDVMETLNYLVCSGNCYIVLGMEREPVEKAIISYYRGTHEDLTNQDLTLKATRYLEKIINIEIPVPAATPAQVGSLITSKEEAAFTQTKKWNWLSPILFFVALSSSIILGSYFAGVISINSTDVQQTSSPTDANESTTNNTELSAQTNSIPKTKPLQVLSSFEKPTTQDQTIYIVIPILTISLIALVIRLERFRQRKQIVEQDSAPFVKAIAVWAQALGTSNHTPRSIKRYVNRARYLAMRNIASNAGIKEENLVTLAALLEFADQNNVDDIDQLKSYLPDFKEEDFDKEIKALLDKLADITTERKAKFLHWINGIRVN
ncbi:KAP family NTPase [Paraglaciecola aquimarina]|uniref:KAP family NTPase n=1 Tax=Paraglaciecola algarum TaxID=3050085 RepID=A0ABS9D740_9ALTE|nr:P-loop NTPase fold protein [Paraglaciecola sp. G1-23]MCF2948725.1 KAP family NTPase [Paraglaciecola sp. G1-23]